jgi:hypothetical protein
MTPKEARMAATVLHTRMRGSLDVMVLDKDAGSWFITDSSLRGYDGSQVVREEISVGQKKLVRKTEPPSKSRIRWPRWTGFRGMTLRDWLPIFGTLLIPVVIAAGTWGITWQQGKIEEQRAQADREIQEQRAQDEALQAYLDQMNQLILEKDPQD